MTVWHLLKDPRARFCPRRFTLLLSREELRGKLMQAVRNFGRLPEKAWFEAFTRGNSVDHAPGEIENGRGPSLR